MADSDEEFLEALLGSDKPADIETPDDNATAQDDMMAQNDVAAWDEAAERAEVAANAALAALEDSDEEPTGERMVAAMRLMAAEAIEDRVADGAARYRRGHRDGNFSREEEGVEPEDGLPWCAGAHGLQAPRLLTADDPRAPNPPGFKGELYAPQATILAAMLELERRPTLRIGDPLCLEEWKPQMQSKTARVSEKFSFGKTVLALALVCAQRVPARLPEQAPLATYATKPNHNRAHVFTGTLDAGRATSDFSAVGRSVLPETTIRYERFLPLTVVAAASNVISQWEENTRRFTSLRYLTVENVKNLREFERVYRDGGLTAYDLLFLKAGRVTTSFVVKGEEKLPQFKNDPKAKSKAKARSLFEAVARVLEGVPVARLIIDDYDTLKLFPDDRFIPALFTWLISATRRRATAVLSVTPATSLDDYLRANVVTPLPIVAASLDDTVNRIFSLHCSARYVDAHLNTTAVGFRRVFVRGGEATAILRNLDVPEEVLEMLNANAVGTAAQTLGIAANSVADVIRRVVGSHVDKLRAAVQVRDLAEWARGEVAARGGSGERDAERVKALRAAIRSGSRAQVEAALGTMVCGPSREVTACLDELVKWADEQEAKHNQSLTRMRDNIREGQCQCCMVPFDSETAAYVLVGCCQIIVCEVCITREEGRRRVYIRRCPNCARDINVKAGLVRVGADLDLEEALRDDALLAAGANDEAPPEPEPEPEPEAAPTADPHAVAVAAIADPKLRALVQLVSGRAVECLRDEKAPAFVAGLLCGRRNSPWPDDKPKKYLIFTMYPESTQELGATLDRCGVTHAVLRGNRDQKDEAVRKIRSGEVSVLLATSAKDSGGLHLPFLSHIVLFHRVLDKNVEAQAVARGQRLGREHNLEVVALLNEVEAAAA